MKTTSQKKEILVLMEMGNERMRIMKDTITSLCKKIDSPNNARFGQYPLFMISEVFRSLYRGI